MALMIPPQTMAKMPDEQAESYEGNDESEP
jgi:hypothetical protein